MNHIKGSYNNLFKPILDKIFSFGLIILSIPFFCTIATINSILGLPVFFFHKRPGFGADRFVMVKFCTIDPRSKKILPFSAFLRRTSLDEIPQLINILKGEMTFVGPRPLLTEYLETYNDEQMQRHSVKPGITGLAQVYGRNALSLDEKLALDISYVQNVSFYADLRILLKTFVQVFKFKEADGHLSTANS